MAQRDDGTDTMTRERMAEILAAYGASPSRWPAAERGRAEVWARNNAETFASLVREEAALDAALDLDVRPAHDLDALAARIIASASPGNVVHAEFGRTKTAAWRTAAALAACAVLGLVIGFNGAARDGDMSAEIDAAFGAAFDLSAPGFGDGAGG